MSFFDRPGPSPLPSRRSPSWMGAPENWVPGLVPVALVVANDGETAVTISRIAVFPAGFEFDVIRSLRTEPADRGLLHSMGHGPDAMLIGVGYANGMRGTCSASPAGERRSGDVTLLPLGGHGSRAVFRQTVWVSPLPVPGPVEFVVSWPARGLAEASVTVEGSLILDAADRAVELWPDEPEAEPVFDAANAPPLPPGGSPPEDADASEAAIRAAFAQVFDNGPKRSTDPLEAVQDGPAFAGVLEQVRARFPLEAATTRVAVGGIVFLDGVRAAVQFQFATASGLGMGPQLGYAVRDRGRWKVARDTYGRVLGMAGVPLPPPPPPA